MIEYFEKNSYKQAIKIKPIRFRYKVFIYITRCNTQISKYIFYEGWSQNTPQGYVIAFDLYQGKTL
jgi:hypothetical protein